MSKLVRFDPFAEIDALQKQLFSDDWMMPSRGVMAPTTDVYTNDKNELVVEAHLPNFAEKDINIEIENGALVIQAAHYEEEKDKTKKYVVRESSSSFYRRIALPDRADSDKIEAHLDGGVLKVTVPLSPLPEPKKIAVKTKK